MFFFRGSGLAINFKAKPALWFNCTCWGSYVGRKYREPYVSHDHDLFGGVLSFRGGGGPQQLVFVLVCSLQNKKKGYPSTKQPHMFVDSGETQSQGFFSPIMFC